MMKEDEQKLFEHVKNSEWIQAEKLVVSGTSVNVFDEHGKSVFDYSDDLRAKRKLASMSVVPHGKNMVSLIAVVSTALTCLLTFSLALAFSIQKQDLILLSLSVSAAICVTACVANFCGGILNRSSDEIIKFYKNPRAGVADLAANQSDLESIGSQENSADHDDNHSHRALEEGRFGINPNNNRRVEEVNSVYDDDNGQVVKFTSVDPDDNHSHRAFKKGRFGINPNNNRRVVEMTTVYHDENGQLREFTSVDHYDNHSHRALEEGRFGINLNNVGEVNSVGVGIGSIKPSRVSVAKI